MSKVESINNDKGMWTTLLFWEGEERERERAPAKELFVFPEILRSTHSSSQVLWQVSTLNSSIYLRSRPLPFPLPLFK